MDFRASGGVEVDHSVDSELPSLGKEGWQTLRLTGWFAVG